jgi:hypothetical protein
MPFDPNRPHPTSAQTSVVSQPGVAQCVRELDSALMRSNMPGHLTTFRHPIP